MKTMQQLLATWAQQMPGDFHGSFGNEGWPEDEVKEFMANPDIHFYRGKVRDCLLRSGTIEIFQSDRLSAYDRAIGLVPFRGVILTDFAEFWFKRLPDHICHHYIERKNDRTVVCHRTKPLPVEIIWRRFLTGGLWRKYQEGARSVCGQNLPDGLSENHRFAEPLLTPTTKAAAFEHDEDISPEEILSKGLVSPDHWDKTVHMTRDLFLWGEETFAKADLVLVDTKYEVGTKDSGELAIIDEIHTPDSSRIWVVNDANGSPTMYDKEIVRKKLANLGFTGEGKVPTLPCKDFVELSLAYAQVFEKLTRGLES